MYSGPKPSPRPLRRTTFLVPNLHCPTCASFIGDFLFCLRPRPFAIETSIVSQTVIVKHDASLSARAIATVLGEAGYEVDTIVTDPVLGSEESGGTRRGADDDFPFKWLNRAVDRLGRRLTTADEEIKRMRHVEHCEQCRLQRRQPEEEQHNLKFSSARSSDDQGASPLVIIDTGSTKRLRATVSITGMSCSSCVGKITSALEEKPWVRSASVALLTQSAVIEYDGEHNTEELINIVKGEGYQASLEEVEELRPSSKHGADTGADLWRASYSITGMTCSSCVGNITEALEALPWIQNVDVNLITSSATVLFENRSHLPEVVRAVQGAGYEATLNDIVDVGEEKKKDPRRTVSIRVDGMYCQHCPGRVADVMKQFAESVAVLNPVSFKDPIMTISYIPRVPEFTIRTIMSAIEGADPSFHPVVYHPPTVEERARQMHARIRRRILYRVLLAIIAAIPSLIIGIVYMSLVSESNPSRQYLMQRLRGVTRAEWALFIMATPVYFFAADVFHRRTIKELHSLWRPDSPVPLLRRFYRFGSMDMLMSFGTTIAYFASIAELIVAATVRHEGDMSFEATYFDSVVFLTMFLLIGRLIEAYSKAKTGEAVSKLGNLRPKEALLVLPSDGAEGSGRTQNVHVGLLEFNDVVRVVHGGSPPWDGFLLEGKGEFAESSLTGESLPVKKTIGDPIYSGTINQGGPILMRITGTSGESMLDQIIKVVREGQARRAPIERVADKLTSKFVPTVTLIAIATWFIWLGLGLSGRLPDDYLDVEVGGWAFWSLQFAIAVFVIACPCGIGLAAPTALFVGGGLAAKYGILAKGGGEAFQEASKLDIIVFDKTGTLTEGGEPKLTDHEFLFPNKSAWTEQVVLNCLAELESNSSHPIAKAVAAFCKSKGAVHAAAKTVEEVPGKGMKGSFADNSLSYPVEILVGNEALLADHDIVLDEKTLATLDSWKGQAKSIVLVAGRLVAPDQDLSWEALAILATSDPIRPESRPVLEALRRLGIETWMLSGDNVKTARAVGAMVGIPAENIIAGVLPEQKADKIKYLQASQVKARSRGLFGLARQPQSRAVVAMVGDGVNDSPALTVADVGIAIGSGSDIAISAAEFVLVKSNLTTLLTLISLSRAVFRRVKFNFAWALVYNLVALPVAAGVLYPVKSNGSHVRMDPVWASLAMALSSISVIWIGKGLAEVYLSRPNHVVIGSVRDKTATSAQELNKLPTGTGSTLLLVSIESTSPSDVPKAVKEIEDSGISHIDIVISNSGVSPTPGPLDNVDPNDVISAFNINAVGPIYLFKGVKHLLEKSQGSPKWVAISTGAASITNVEVHNAHNVLAYGMTKASQNFFTL
ncbi:hypothetical protein AAE478_010375 [Parahypoxylon ruwenzoriense]